MLTMLRSPAVTCGEQRKLASRGLGTSLSSDASVVCRLHSIPRNKASAHRARRHVQRKELRVQAASTESLELVLDLKGKLLESPAWDARLERLIFVDTDGQRIHTFDPFAAADAPDRLISVQLPEPVGFVALTEVPDQVLAGMERRIVLVDLQKQSIISDVAITPEDHGADGHRFNDGKPGPAGVCIFGRKHESSEAPDGQRGRVYRLDLGPDVTTGTLTEVMSPEETQLPNGMGWDMEKHVMYLNDTFMKEFGDTPGVIWEIKVDQQGVPVRTASQQLERRVVYKINVEKEGGPDGMTLDSRGRIWLALAKGGKLICVDPSSNKEVHRIDMPIQMPTACAFGGKDLDELYITSTELGGGKGAGGLWRYKLEDLKGISAAHLATVQSS